MQLGRLVHLVQNRLEEITFPFVQSFPENLEQDLGLQLGQPARLFHKVMLISGSLLIT